MPHTGKRHPAALAAIPAAAPSPSTSLDVREVITVKAGVFKDTCLQLLERVHAREIEFEVTKRGTPVARVIPPDSRAPSAHGFMRGTVVHQGDIVSPDFELWGDLA